MGELQILQRAKVCKVGPDKSRNRLNEEKESGVKPRKGKSWGRHVCGTTVQVQIDGKENIFFLLCLVTPCDFDVRI